MLIYSNIYIAIMVKNFLERFLNFQGNGKISSTNHYFIKLFIKTFINPVFRLLTPQLLG